MFQQAIRKWLSGRARKVRRRPTPRTRLGLEQLETRETASSLQFVSNALAVGMASLNGTKSQTSWYMARGSVYGPLARVKTPRDSVSLAASSATLRYSDYGDHSKRIEMSTYANASGRFKNATAQVHLTESGYNNGPGFVTLAIRPTAGDWIGRRVLVTLTATYRNTNIVSSTGHNFVQVSYGFSGQNNLIMGADYRQPPGGQTVRKSVSFYATVGSTFRIAETVYSFAGSNTASGANVVLDITTKDL
jgi:hypothetical protein